MKIKILLDEEEIPKKWYNVAADMPTPREHLAVVTATESGNM